MGKFGDTITLDSPLDMHVHFRAGGMLQTVVPLTTSTFAGALVMPNVVPTGFDVNKEVGITSLEMLLAYGVEIQNVAGPDFSIYLTLFFQTSYTREFLEKAKPHIIAIKLYPQGITTNSQGGCDPKNPDVLRVLKIMEELEIPLCVHGETDGFVMDREKEFMKLYATWATDFPKLKIIMEHITTVSAVELLEIYPNLHATITVHHLLITLNDVAGGMLNPHLFCKPIAKRPEDLYRLRDSVFNRGIKQSTLAKIMLGTDSAPHPQNKKESACGCAGVFTAPIALQILAQEFEGHGDMELFQEFVSGRARRIYGITPRPKILTLERKPFKIPDVYGNVVPMWAGRELEWSVQDVAKSS